MSDSLSDCSYDRNETPDALSAKKRATNRAKTLRSKLKKNVRDKTADVL